MARGKLPNTLIADESQLIKMVADSWGWSMERLIWTRALPMRLEVLLSMPMKGGLKTTADETGSMPMKEDLRTTADEIRSMLMREDLKTVADETGGMPMERRTVGFPS